MSSGNSSSLVVKEMTATRKAVAMIAQRMTAIEAAVNSFTNMKEQQYEDEKRRRRESTWG